jgi:ABC-type dipeptide/oligopeptide/nickel transport system permease subunit
VVRFAQRVDAVSLAPARPRRPRRAGWTASSTAAATCSADVAPSSGWGARRPAAVAGGRAPPHPRRARTRARRPRRTAAPGPARPRPAGRRLLARLEPPSAAHPLGTDELGRDYLLRLAYGAGSRSAWASRERSSPP